MPSLQIEFFVGTRHAVSGMKRLPDYFVNHQYRVRHSEFNFQISSNVAVIKNNFALFVSALKVLVRSTKNHSAISAYPPRLCGKNAFSSLGVMLFHRDFVVKFSDDFLRQTGDMA